MDALADADCVLTLQALAEFFHAVTRKGKMPAEEAAALVHDWMELFPVAAADGRTLRARHRPEERRMASASGMPCWWRPPGPPG